MGALSASLWRGVERVHRLPRWQRALLTLVWVIVAVGAVYLWMNGFDCPICDGTM